VPEQGRRLPLGAALADERKKASRPRSVRFQVMESGGVEHTDQ
jgi:hypothetical protein